MRTYRRRHKRKLTLRQTRAISNYLANGGNKYRALKDAGYTECTARGNPSGVFRQPEFAAELEKRQKKEAAKNELTQQWVTQRLMVLANSNHILAKFKFVNEKGELYWDFASATVEDLAAITELTTEIYMEGRDDNQRPVKKIKIGMADPKAALDSLGRHLGMFNDKVTVTNEVSLVERLQRGRVRARAKNTEEDAPVSRDTND